VFYQLFFPSYSLNDLGFQTVAKFTGIVFIAAAINSLHYIVCKGSQGRVLFVAIHQEIKEAGCYPILPLPTHHLLLGLNEIAHWSIKNKMFSIHEIILMIASLPTAIT
jgi:hypothetical protein